jgi:glycosyltransferase involved in cell wall biosynthesis
MIMSDKKSDYPRVLVVNGEPFNRQSATGVTLANLFGGWPKEKLAQIVTSNMPPDNEYCNNTVKLGLLDHQFIYQLNNLFTKQNYPLLRKRTVDGNCESNTCVDKCNSKQSSLRDIARDFLDIVPYKIDKQLLDWLNIYKPEVIYSCLANIRLTVLVTRISTKLDIPIVPHFMDDWPTTKYSQVTCCIQRRILLAELKRLFIRTDKCLAISETMALEYQNRFGKSFTPFMNCINSDIRNKSRKIDNKSRRLSLYYIGNLNHGRLNMLKSIAIAAKELERDDIDIKIHIFAGNLSENQKHELFVPNIMIFERKFKDAYVPDIHEKCDCFIHVDSFEEQYRKYFRLSLSTKIPLYMSCGLPILAYGPKDVCSNQYIDSTGAGLVVGEENITALLATLRELALNPERRCLLGRRGWEVANERHNAEKERERFRSVIADVTLPIFQTS